MHISRADEEALVREKYHGDIHAPGLTEDRARLARGEPLAYVIGNIPFCGLTVGLDSRPLIPRPETEWWTELLIHHLIEKSNIKKNTTIYRSIRGKTARSNGGEDVRVLDLCSGSGAIGLSVLAHCPNVQVSFGELVEEHAELIRNNLKRNGLDASRADIRTGNLYVPFEGKTYNSIVANPPYIPDNRILPPEVVEYEPSVALYAGEEGLSLIRLIIKGAREHLCEDGELWIECDQDNAEKTLELARKAGAQRSEMHTDLYGRPRLVVSYW